MARKEIVITLACIAAIATVIVVAGLAAYTFTNSGTILESGTITYYLNGQEWTTNIIDWGNINAGSTVTKQLDVDNAKNVDVTVSLIASPPSGLTLTWASNNTVIPMQTQVNGQLTLDVAVDVIPGAFSFTAVIEED